MKKVLHIFLMCLIVTPGFSQISNRVVTFDYRKESNGTSMETATVYADPYAGSYMFVHTPVVQWIKMVPEHLMYFYPIENMALIMNNPELTISTSPVQLFVFGGSEDLGLGDLGFSLVDHALKNDTLVKTWELKGKKKKEYIRIDVASTKRNVCKTTTFDADDRVIKTVEFSQWIERDDRIYPGRIRIREENKDDIFYFDHIDRLPAVPDSVKHQFVLPLDCDIHEYTF